MQVCLVSRPLEDAKDFVYHSVHLCSIACKQRPVGHNDDEHTSRSEDHESTSLCSSSPVVTKPSHSLRVKEGPSSNPRGDSSAPSDTLRASWACHGRLLRLLEVAGNVLCACQGLPWQALACSLLRDRRLVDSMALCRGMGGTSPDSAGGSGLMLWSGQPTKAHTGPSYHRVDPRVMAQCSSPPAVLPIASGRLSAAHGVPRAVHTLTRNRCVLHAATRWNRFQQHP